MKSEVATIGVDAARTRPLVIGPGRLGLAHALAKRFGPLMEFGLTLLEDVVARARVLPD